MAGQNDYCIMNHKKFLQVVKGGGGGGGGLTIKGGIISSEYSIYQVIGVLPR